MFVMMPNILPDITASQKYTAAFLTQERTYCKIFHKQARIMYNDILWALMRFVIAVSLIAKWTPNSSVIEDYGSGSGRPMNHGSYRMQKIGCQIAPWNR